MISNPECIGIDYEPTRLSRYGQIKRITQYTAMDFLEAYDAWANAPYGREPQWDKYCDIRDCVPHGTNAKIRKHRTEAMLRPH